MDDNPYKSPTAYPVPRPRKDRLRSHPMPLCGALTIFVFGAIAFFFFRASAAFLVWGAVLTFVALFQSWRRGIG